MNTLPMCNASVSISVLHAVKQKSRGGREGPRAVPRGCALCGFFASPRQSELLLLPPPRLGPGQGWVQRCWQFQGVLSALTAPSIPVWATAGMCSLCPCS